MGLAAAGLEEAGAAAAAGVGARVGAEVGAAVGSDAVELEPPPEQAAIRPNDNVRTMVRGAAGARRVRVDAGGNPVSWGAGWPAGRA